ncbi:hypothetical protein GUJ93_ZPchr0010g8493 [Zizania palustris]|uniref:Uncharacterized protein n=1 Tax=Zizania palustris TaxID=103762 RepID=A0A8J5SZC4_ZIZPA|nr:hypothetical protein GUJ93_ZPchr0010g8493 [Zizania palustris]
MGVPATKAQTMETSTTEMPTMVLPSIDALTVIRGVLTIVRLTGALAVEEQLTTNHTLEDQLTANPTVTIEAQLEMDTATEEHSVTLAELALAECDEAKEAAVKDKAEAEAEALL